MQKNSVFEKQKNKRNLLFHKSREPCPTPALLTARGFAHHARTLMLISVLPSAGMLCRLQVETTCLFESKWNKPPYRG